MSMTKPTSDQVTFTSSGTGAQTLTVKAKLQESISIEDFGAIGDGSTDNTVAIQNAINYVQNSTNKQMVLTVPAKTFLVSGTLTITGSVVFKGEGFLDFENTRPTTIPPKGSWFIHGSAAGALFQYTGNLGKNSGIFDIGIFQTGHATPGVGWTPTVKDWVIRNENTEGTLQLVRVHFHNVYKGVLTDKAHRPHYEDITGQFFYRGFSFDQIYDLGKFEGLHAWTYWSENTYVLQYQQLNSIAVTLLRVDGLYLDRLFTFAVETALYIGNSAYGTARAIFVNGLYADFTGRALVVDAATNAEVQVNNIYHLGQAWPTSPVAALNNSAIVDISSGTNHNVQINNGRSVLTNTYAVRVIGTNNRLWFTSALLEQYDVSASGIGACYATSTNVIFFSFPATITRYDAATPYLFTGTPGGIISAPIKQSITTVDNNKPVTSSAVTGQSVAYTVEGETNAGVAVVGLGTGTVNVGATTNKLSFFGSGGVVKPTVSGSTAGNVALQNLCGALAQLGLITNSTT